MGPAGSSQTTSRGRRGAEKLSSPPIWQEVASFLRYGGSTTTEVNDGSSLATAETQGGPQSCRKWPLRQEAAAQQAAGGAGAEAGRWDAGNGEQINLGD